MVGHRGGRGEGWPTENTIEAFERAREQGARAVELDARTCAGGDVVVLHDPTDDPLPALRARGVPTLAEALAWARDRGVAVNVELKHDSVARTPRRGAGALTMVARTPRRGAGALTMVARRRLAGAAARAVREGGADVLFSSFDPLLLAMAAALAPRVPRALLVHARQRAWADAVQRAARPPLVGALHLERTQTEPREIAAATRRGLRVGVWTVNDPREARDLAALGVATIITDRPGEILAALTDR